MAATRRRCHALAARGLAFLLLACYLVVLSEAFDLDSVYLKSIRPEEKIVLRGNDFYDQCRDLNASRRTIELVELRAGLRDKSARLVEISGLAYLFRERQIESLATLFFPLEEYGQRENLARALEDKSLNPEQFRLEVLNMSGNGLTGDLLDGYSFGMSRAGASLSSILAEFFSGVRLLQLSHNSLRHLDRHHFGLFIGDEGSQIEALLLDHNGLTSIRHDALHDLTALKYLDLSFNQLKIVHPFTLTMCSGSLLHLDLSHNQLQAVYKTTPYQIVVNGSLSNETNGTSLQPWSQDYQYDDDNTLTALNRLRLESNAEIRCDCGLLWLIKLRSQIEIDDFICKYETVESSESTFEDPVNNGSVIKSTNYTSTFSSIAFSSIKSAESLESKCRSPNLVVNVDKLKATSTFEFFRWVSRSWFNWAVFPDYMPPIIPFPYLSTFSLWPELAPQLSEAVNETLASADNGSNGTESVGERQQSTNKHIFFTWRMSDVVFDCEDELAEKDAVAPASRLKSAIIWKTQYGYLSYLDRELAETFKSKNLSECARNESSLTVNEEDESGWQRSFQIFYKMNKLTRIYQNMSIMVSSRFGTQSVSHISVNDQNQLKITNIRKVVAGPIVCIALNAQGVRTYEFDINMRSGIGENFIYSLFISLIAGIVPSIAGIAICCYCEYEADKNYPMTPPCYPTPTAATPPNFDINEWMSNAASYLPNLNISETLEQVSKKLRKGMEKATVTVKSLGLTSSAYIYSMYEQSTQRFQDIRSYVPNINVPTISLPTMRYPPMGDLANRMRMGMGNMFIHFKEFCGTSDLTHTPSIVDIEADTNASNALGRGYIIDQINLKRQQNTHYRFLNFIREESKRSAAACAPSTSGSSESKDSGDSSSSSTPTTSGLASVPVDEAANKPVRGKDSSGIYVYARTSQTPPNDDDDDDDDSVDSPLPDKPSSAEEQV